MEASEVFKDMTKLDRKLPKKLNNYRMLTGDRPTGPLHIGHYFGSLLSRRHLQNLGIESYIVIADYQVLIDRNSADQIENNIREIILDYLSIGIDPFDQKTFIFVHSAIPELNQLMLPLLKLVNPSELQRNPTIKNEIKFGGFHSINSLMLTYPIHQSADILFSKANIVPVGRDQLPHIELTKKIVKRFNERFGLVFHEPTAILSSAPTILGLDGCQKMSKSRQNAIFLGASEKQTKDLINSAKTDNLNYISYDPVCRPEISNLVKLTALCLNNTPNEIVTLMNGHGCGKLKSILAESLNEHLFPIRQKRLKFARDKYLTKEILARGNKHMREIACKTLVQVKAAMKMLY